MNYTTFYAKLTPNGAAVGTKYSVSVSGITAIVEGQKTYSGQAMYFAITPKSSGNATVTFRNDTTGDVIGTRPILIRSTTLAVPTYALTASATSVNEGGTVTFSIDTSDVPVNTNVAYAITGVTTADISLGSLTGNFVVTADGGADLPITIINDALSEGTETLTLTLTGKGLSKAVTINDTSLTPTYNVGWYSNSAGTTAITSANEGTTAYLVVKTTNVANGTVLPVTLSGTGVNASDFSTGALTGNITINSNIGYLTYTLTNDLITEGAETITATVKSGSTTVGTDTLVINDTSLATTYAIDVFDTTASSTAITEAYYDVDNAFIFTVGQWYDSVNNSYMRGYKASNGTGAIVENNLYIDGIKFNPDQAYGSYLDPITGSINYVAYILTGTPGINFSDGYRFKLTNMTNGNAYYSGNGSDVVVVNNRTLMAANSPEHRDIILSNLLIVGHNVKLEIERL